MIVVETSALVALILGEPEGATFAARLAEDPERLVSAVSVVEAGMVTESRVGPGAGAQLDALISTMEVVPVDPIQVRTALAAWRRFGKGHHPAGLNLGDCFSYALARTSGAPLLFKGGDFSATDITIA